LVWAILATPDTPLAPYLPSPVHFLVTLELNSAKVADVRPTMAADLKNGDNIMLTTLILTLVIGITQPPQPLSPVAPARLWEHIILTRTYVHHDGDGV
jgi:hypothetical protein